MEEQPFRFQLVVLGYGAILAGLAWMARTLRNNEPVGPLRLIGGVMGASIASFSFGAIVLEFFDVSNMFLLGVSGVVGWIGGDVLAALATFLERKLGIGIRPPKKKD